MENLIISSQVNYCAQLLFLQKLRIQMQQLDSASSAEWQKNHVYKQVPKAQIATLPASNS